MRTADTALAVHTLMEDDMKHALIALVLLSLTLAGCIVEPYGGRGDRSGGYYSQTDHGPHGDWSH